MAYSIKKITKAVIFKKHQCAMFKIREAKIFLCKCIGSELIGKLLYVRRGQKCCTYLKALLAKLLELENQLYIVT